MERRVLTVLVVALFSGVALTGCIADGALTPQAAPDLSGLVPIEAGLWDDKQNAPHPAFNYPTLSNPVAGGLVPPYWAPIAAREHPAPITGIEHVAETKADVVSGGGAALFGSLAVVPGLGEPSAVVDISDPTMPKVLGFLAGENGGHRGATILAYPDGRLVSALSTSKGFDVWEITDPTAPSHLAFVEVEGTGGHKVGIVPGTPILYNANSKGGSPASDAEALLGNGQGVTQIYDLSNPAAPALVQVFENGYGCHHIYFYIDGANEKYRALCAGIEYTQIWDIADPLNPTIVVSIPVHHGKVGLPSYSTYANFAHFAILNDEGNILIVGDETGGGGLPPGCDARVDTPVKQLSGPFGNLWFYDVTDEKNPQLLGWFSPTTVLPKTESCTAHHGRLVPDAERDLLAMAFYGAGVVLVDFTNPSDPREVDAWVGEGANTWEVWYYNGYLFTGDIARGMDVLTFK